VEDIHSTVIIDPGAKIGENVKIGPYSIIKDDVVIGEGCVIETGVFVESGTRMGKNCKISHSAVLGTAPQDLKYAEEKTYLEIGDNNTIREFVTLNRGTAFHKKTVIGSNCLIMAYAHVAHDCIIGDNVIISNAVQMGGHVEIHPHAIIGGLTAIHQFVKIGQHAFVGGGLRVPKDVPPFIMAMGEPIRYGGTNHIGLTRKGFSKEVSLEIKRAYQLVYQTNYMLKEAIEAIEEQLNPFPEIKQITAFLRKSNRGLIRG
jgi:UDP-N-acetylglucosamine acyltransferase